MNSLHGCQAAWVTLSVQVKSPSVHLENVPKVPGGPLGLWGHRAQQHKVLGKPLLWTRLMLWKSEGVAVGLT